MKCTHCGYVTASYIRFCPGCNTDLGFPNVRLAEIVEEKAALAKRLTDAEVSTGVRTCRDILDAFGREVLTSQVVIARSLALVHNLLNSENELYVGYYKQVQSGARIPEDNKWDKGRTAADSTVSPLFFDELVYGALSLNRRGVSAFGGYSILLRENMIRLRSTVFEENPFIFCQRHKVNAGQPAPLGYRAIWSERDQLAKAKLHSQIYPTTTSGDFPKILLRDAKDVEDAEFIEVHIYGPIHQSAIERVVGPRPHGGADLAIWKSVEGKLKKLGASMEII